MIRKYCDGFPEKWDKVLDKACFALRVRKHNVTQFSPFFLLYGRDPRLPGDTPPDKLFDFTSESERDRFTARELESLGQARAASLVRSQLQAKRMIQDQKMREEVEDQVFIPGMYVKKKNFTKEALDYPWTGPYIVLEVLANSLYRLMGVDGSVIQPLVHQDDLRIYSSQDKSKFYHNRKMRNLGDHESSENNSEFSEGGVVV
jgi:hypothetical protein